MMGLLRLFRNWAVIIAGAAAIVSTPALAQTSATANSSATVVTPLTLVSDGSSLDFSSFQAGTGGTVVVTQAGAVSATGDVVLLSSSPASAAGFDVTGEANESFLVSGDTSVTLTGPVGSTPMNATLDAPTAAQALGAGGAASFAVGGTLTVGNAQTPGAYSGTFNVTVAYQ